MILDIKALFLIKIKKYSYYHGNIYKHISQINTPELLHIHH